MNSAILNHAVFTVTTSQLRSEGFPETELILTLNSGAKLTELEILVFVAVTFEDNDLKNSSFEQFATLVSYC